MKTETKSEILNRLFKENGLLEEDYFKHSQYTILTRSGIEKIQYKNNVTIRYEVITMTPVFCVVKAIASKKAETGGTITIETFGSAGHNANGEFQKGKQFQYLYYPELSEKRALSRAVLKICNFYELGVFGEDESDSFHKGIEEGIASANEMKGVERKTASKQANAAKPAKVETPKEEPTYAPIPDGLLDVIEGAVSREELIEIWTSNKHLQSNPDFTKAINRAKEKLPADDTHPLQNPYGIPLAMTTEILLLLNHSSFSQDEKEKMQAKMKEKNKLTEPGKAELWAKMIIDHLKAKIKERSMETAA